MAKPSLEEKYVDASHQQFDLLLLLSVALTPIRGKQLIEGSLSISLTDSFIHTTLVTVLTMFLDLGEVGQTGTNTSSIAIKSETRWLDYPNWSLCSRSGAETTVKSTLCNRLLLHLRYSPRKNAETVKILDRGISNQTQKICPNENSIHSNTIFFMHFSFN